MKIQIDADEAKTRLPELLRGVQSGRQYTITHRGEAIADLVPAKGTGRQYVATAIEEMKLFMAENPTAAVDIKALIGEGRA